MEGFVQRQTLQLDALLSVIYELVHPASAELFMDVNNDYLYASKHNSQILCLLISVAPTHSLPRLASICCGFYGTWSEYCLVSFWDVCPWSLAADPNESFLFFGSSFVSVVAVCCTSA
ncbi:hypothetical protein XF_1991 [Xylella fastidiosa 9a5c]|uniref:Uncharacterized protein n=1 Tax=Xylella fastidiosa (strain 9a5c) TaxID=160492 RepID=Q9PBZ4_XYLFA|nr:hypothetical protein [Xylella fastidiosa]AAF84793.1 hypothetical protein XF_1991 [Xylella fastidiosa 9a5c]